MLWYLLIPLIPTLFWITYFYLKDKPEKEPKKLIFYSILLGAVSTFFVAEAEYFFLTQFGLIRAIETVTIFGFLGMLVVGAVEEIAKFLTLRFSFFRSKYFNEISDGILYGVGIGLGFAFAENIFYTLQYGLTTSIARAVITPIFHAAAAATSGYFLALSIGKDGYKLKYYGIFLASVIHGTSNFLLVVAASTTNYIPLVFAGVLNLGLVIWLFSTYKKSLGMPCPAGKEINTSPFVALFVNVVPGFGYIYLKLWDIGFLYLILVIYLALTSTVAQLTLFPFWPWITLIAYTLIAFLWAVSSITVFRKAKAL